MQQNGYILFNQRKNQLPKKHRVPQQENKTEKIKQPEENSEDFEKKTGNSQEQKFDNASNNEKLELLSKNIQKFEYHIKAHWLFELFPNEVVIDIHKLSFIEKQLLYKNVTSILIKDIAKVEVTNDWLFATLEVINLTQTITLDIKHLRKDEARIALAIIQGMMVAYKNNIDLAELEPEKIMDKLLELGSPVL